MIYRTISGTRTGPPSAIRLCPIQAIVFVVLVAHAHFEVSIFASYALFERVKWFLHLLDPALACVALELYSPVLYWFFFSGPPFL